MARHTGLSASLGTTSSAAGATAEKENLREGIVPKPIREVVIQLREKLKENRKLADEFTAASTDRTIKVKEQIKDVEHKMCEVYSKTSDCDVKCAQLRRRVVKDLYLGDVAQRVQDLGSMTVSDLKEVLTRFDVAFSTVASKLFDATRKVQDVKSVLTADGSLCMLRDAVSRRADAASTSKSFNNLRGSDFIPSQSAIAELGKQLKPTVGAAPAATGTGRPGNNCHLDQTKIRICAPINWLLLYELPSRSFRIDNERILVWLKHDST
ncbi:hypothetical protein ANCDUO_08955 [Ancylostoma duodenale]|uniref:Uncharacterized protein n=1 Tax=Ancylostoma duodenale TaxID=51022 RepID=A0A0C2GUE0_9BILA|nr:hypothetical protein ANCDUO_08955 [Ancylostoma duodenale]